MDDIEIREEVLYFDRQLLDAWKENDYSMLYKSEASSFLKAILPYKKSKRKNRDRRFFGEAYIASRIQMTNGWYNSYHWLKKTKTNQWITGKGIRQKPDEPLPFKNLFYKEAVVKYIGKDNLANLQKYSEVYQNSNPGKYPKAPDMFIVDKKSNFHFLEIKLPGDSIDPQQEVGLRILQEHFNSQNCSSVIVKKIHLFPADKKLVSK